jgi:hypothetical protein
MVVLNHPGNNPEVSLAPLSKLVTYNSQLENLFPLSTKVKTMKAMASALPLPSKVRKVVTMETRALKLKTGSKSLI